MELILKSNHSLITDQKVIGVESENKSEYLIVKIEDSSLYDKWAYIEFVLDNKTEFLTPRLEIVDGTITYEIPNSILVGGFMQLQVVFRDSTEWVWKSFIKSVMVKHSLNVDADVAEANPDFISQAQEILDHCQSISVDVENKVDNTRKINGYTLEDDIDLNAPDIHHFNISNNEIDTLF